MAHLREIVGAGLIAENTDPTDALTTEELASANAHRPFVSDEAFALPLEKLVDRCRAVLAQDNRPAMFLYGFYGGQRAGLTGDESPLHPQVQHAQGRWGVPRRGRHQEAPRGGL